MVVNGGKITEIVPLYKYLQSVRWAKKFLSVCHLDQQSRVYLLKSQRTFYRCVLRSLSVGILISVDYWWTTNVAVRGLDEVNSIQVNVKKMSGDCLVPQNNAVDSGFVRTIMSSPCPPLLEQPILLGWDVSLPPESSRVHCGRSPEERWAIHKARPGSVFIQPPPAPRVRLHPANTRRQGLEQEVQRGEAATQTRSAVQPKRTAGDFSRSFASLTGGRSLPRGFQQNPRAGF